MFYSPRACSETDIASISEARGYGPVKVDSVCLFVLFSSKAVFFSLVSIRVCVPFRFMMMYNFYFLSHASKCPFLNHVVQSFSLAQ